MSTALVVMPFVAALKGENSPKGTKFAWLGDEKVVIHGTDHWQGSEILHCPRTGESFLLVAEKGTSTNEPQLNVVRGYGGTVMRQMKPHDDIFVIGSEGI